MVMSWTDFVSACEYFLTQSEQYGDSWRAQGDPSTPGDYFLSLGSLQTSKAGSVLSCRFDVTYSISYSVPMMYFKMSKDDGSSLTIDEIWELVQVSSEEDPWSTVTQMDHPVLQIPFYAFHACQTEKLMETLEGHGRPVKPHEFLISWLSFMASILKFRFLPEYIVEMSSSAWVLMDEDCDCGGPPPMFNLPPPPIPPNMPCELEMTCPNVLSISDAEFKKIGSFPTVTLLVTSIIVSFIILLAVAGLVWKYFKLRKKRKGVTQTKDFDHGPSMMNGNGVLYEDLAHARPRPPIAPPSIEMLDINHHPLASDGIIGNSKLDFAYFLNPPPIYEELPDHSDRNNGPSEDEFAEDELSVIDVPVNGHDGDAAAVLQARYHNATVGRGTKPRAQSLTRKRGSRNGSNGSNGSAFKSQRSLDRRGRNGSTGSSAKYNTSATNPRGFPRHNTLGGDNNNPGSMLILSNQNGMTMKIPPHLLAVLTESAMCNGGSARPYEIIPTSMGGHHIGTLTAANAGLVPNGVLVNHAGQPMANGTGIYPSSRSSGSSYGDGGSSSASSARTNQQGKSIESSSFDSGIGPNSITSFINSPAYDQTILPPAYSLNTYEYATAAGDGTINGAVVNPAQYLQGQQHPSFRRLRMTPADRDHPLYSNHLLT